jgi:hypothetical protein
LLNENILENNNPNNLVKKHLNYEAKLKNTYFVGKKPTSNVKILAIIEE